MSKQQKDNTSKPLHMFKYCTADRAARLLDCEVEDIFHWAELGYINIYIKFDHEFSYYCPRVKLREGVVKGELINADFGFHFSLSSRPPAPKDDIASRSTFGKGHVAISGLFICVRFPSYVERLSLY